MSVIVYFTSVSGSTEIKSHQQRMFSILDGKKIEYKAVDIAQDAAYKGEMRRKAGNPTALPPQICNGDTYCGDFEMFDNAVEMETLDEFLKI